MERASIPLRYAKVWAVDAAGAYIRTVPVDSQIGIQDGAASFETGFVPDNFSPVAAGGVPPFGQDFNGLMNVVTAWEQWLQAGGAVPFDTDFSTDVGGYPQGAVIDSSIVLGAQWVSLVDNNTTDPDDPLTSTNWRRAGEAAGVLVPFPISIPSGYVAARGDYTLGGASSGATYAAADALFLFAANWSNSQLAIYTSGGVVTTRGANAVADFAANKRLQMPDGRGAGVIGVDAGGSTNLSGVPVVAGNSTTPGSTLGENLHAMTSGENGTHTHINSLTDPGHTHAGSFAAGGGLNNNNGGGGGSFGAFTVYQSVSSNTTGITLTNASSGSGTAHNTVQRSLGVNWGQKL